MLKPTPDAPRETLPDQWSTWVQFPRFQFEDNITHDLHNRSEPGRWVSSDELSVLMDPVAVVADRSGLNWKGKWAGVYNHGRERITQNEVYSADAFNDGETNLYRARVLNHDFLWCDQAISGRALQIVLEQLQDDRFVDIAAMLVRDSFRGASIHAPQQLVTRVGSDEFTDPMSPFGPGEWWDASWGDPASHTYVAFMLDLCRLTRPTFEEQSPELATC